MPKRRSLSLRGSGQPGHRVGPSETPSLVGQQDRACLRLPPKGAKWFLSQRTKIWKRPWLLGPRGAPLLPTLLRQGGAGGAMTLWGPGTIHSVWLS